jgi:hypothetical protein
VQVEPADENGDSVRVSDLQQAVADHVGLVHPWLAQLSLSGQEAPLSPRAVIPSQAAGSSVSFVQLSVRHFAVHPGAVPSGGLRVRRGPSTESDQVGTLGQHCTRVAVVAVVGTADEGWAKLSPTEQLQVRKLPHQTPPTDNS